MSLRELIEKASRDIEMYRHPDVTEVLKKLNRILEAADIGSCDRDELSLLEIEDGNVHMRTLWSARGCEQSSEFCFPESIIDAEDYIKAATLYGLRKKMAHHAARVEHAERDMKHHATELASYTNRWRELSGSEE